MSEDSQRNENSTTYRNGLMNERGCIIVLLRCHDLEYNLDQSPWMSCDQYHVAQHFLDEGLEMALSYT